MSTIKIFFNQDCFPAELCQQTSEVKQLLSKAEGLLREIQIKTNKIQEECTHEPGNFKKICVDSSDNLEIMEDLFLRKNGWVWVGTQCPKCKKISSRPSYDPKVECEKCGGKMKDRCLGLRANVLAHVFQCEVCDHEFVEDLMKKRLL
ncbi:hypothetical protein A2442_03025 [Candidatus Campbellbacteria bacterium RIFOXYC2_FULL_35_25]|uniref:Uncharacterized protein n=1 Tax=Candidatus Campbellbacteria bacterium RIFOXYC2_FULL_35_25 TaxID=1797582 RepID=A0A1F5EJD6_9BACT|nr:MAG: hypothetical protein A2442_03025 [Candidatus Campbellbacteria bacterium RIFOXYC2_FULL_35_25]